MTTVTRGLARVGLIAFAATLLMAGTSRTVRAQEWDSPLASNWAVKVGAFLPVQGTMRSQTASAWWALGVDWDPMFTHNILDGTVFVSAEVLMRSVGGSFVGVVPVTANIVWDITPPEATTRVYGGIGVGAYFVDPLYDDVTLLPGVRFMVGADLSSRLFVQLNYDYVSGFTDDRGAGVRADGVTAFLGCRF